MGFKYDQLSHELVERIEFDRAHHQIPNFGTSDDMAVRRNNNKSRSSLWRPAFVRDCETILHSNYYNRYTDKTQVFSFYKNDEITRRGLHVQLVSRIARNIGRLLGLNIDLIEAIALGHDIGHTPFGHAGERVLDELYYEFGSRHFQHNVHSVRVLDGMIPYNLTLQTLNGILSHNGEMELEEYRPCQMNSFDELDVALEACYSDNNANLKMIPSTLEGCVVRICDIIAYLGKDRQDAVRAHIIPNEFVFTSGVIGTVNAEIINNMTVNIVENSYGKPYIAMSGEYFKMLSAAKRQNYEKIYKVEETDKIIRPLMRRLYQKLRSDLAEGNTSSPIFFHHINDVNKSYYRISPYADEPIDQIVVDYIAGMTDDYFIELYDYLFPKNTDSIRYKGYFDEVNHGCIE